MSSIKQAAKTTFIRLSLKTTTTKYIYRNELDNICKISQIARTLGGQHSKNVLAFLSSRMMETVTKEVRKITISAKVVSQSKH
jgi:hypothetical protein